MPGVVLYRVIMELGACGRGVLLHEISCVAELWRKPFNEAAALGIKVAVCDARGHMLACSNIDGHTAAHVNRLMGDGWHDFLQPEDLPRVLAWFACNCDGGRQNCTECESITYQQLGKLNGKPAMQDITLIKRWAGDAWLCYGAVRFRPQGAPP